MNIPYIINISYVGLIYISNIKSEIMIFLKILVKHAKITEKDFEIHLKILIKDFLSFPSLKIIRIIFFLFISEWELGSNPTNFPLSSTSLCPITAKSNFFSLYFYYFISVYLQYGNQIIFWIYLVCFNKSIFTRHRLILFLENSCEKCEFQIKLCCI